MERIDRAFACRSQTGRGTLLQDPVIRIILSHSSRDLPIRAQAQALEVELYLHELHPDPGTNLPTKIRKAIQSSDAPTFLVTPNTVASSYVNQEIGYALGQSVPVIPLLPRRER